MQPPHQAEPRFPETRYCVLLPSLSSRSRASLSRGSSCSAARYCSAASGVLSLELVEPAEPHARRGVRRPVAAVRRGRKIRFQVSLGIGEILVRQHCLDATVEGYARVFGAHRRCRLNGGFNVSRAVLSDIEIRDLEIRLRLFRLGREHLLVLALGLFVVLQRLAVIRERAPDVPPRDRSPQSRSPAPAPRPCCRRRSTAHRGKTPRDRAAPRYSIRSG